MGSEDMGSEYGTETFEVGTTGGGGLTGDWIGTYGSSPSTSGKSFRLRKNRCSGRTSSQPRIRLDSKM